MILKMIGTKELQTIHVHTKNISIFMTLLMPA